jgi:hypothetical protein
LSAVADVQNTIVKEFAGDPRVVTAVMSQGEPRGTLETFWRNLYLRGPMLFDPTGSVGGQDYSQPGTGFPFAREFVIGPDQTVVLAHFGYDPDLIINTIHDLLAEIPLPGDLDGDGDVDQADLGILLADWGCTGGDCPGDADGDGDTDQADLGVLLANWGVGT